MITVPSQSTPHTRFRAWTLRLQALHARSERARFKSRAYPQCRQREPLRLRKNWMGNNMLRTCSRAEMKKSPCSLVQERQARSCSFLAHLTISRLRSEVSRRGFWRAYLLKFIPHHSRPMPCLAYSRTSTNERLRILQHISPPYLLG